MINKTVKILFTDGTSFTVPGVYGYQYSDPIDPGFSRGLYRRTFPFTKPTSLATFETPNDGAAGTGSLKFRIPDEVMGVAPRTQYELVVLLQLLDADDNVIAEAVTNDLRMWGVIGDTNA